MSNEFISRDELKTHLELMVSKDVAKEKDLRHKLGNIENQLGLLVSLSREVGETKTIVTNLKEYLDKDTTLLDTKENSESIIRLKSNNKWVYAIFTFVQTVVIVYFSVIFKK